MLDERCVGGLAVGELDHPLLAVDVEERFGACAAHRRARRDQALLRSRDGLVGEHLSDQLVDLVRIVDGGQRSEPARQVRLRRSRDTERAEAVVACEVQILEHRQPSRLVDEANHALAPAIGPCIVDGADRAAFLRGQKLLVDQRQVLAELEAPLQPRRRVAQRHALIRAHEIERADRHGLIGPRQQPQMQLIGGRVAQAHARLLLRPRRASAEAAERTARRCAALRTSRSSAPRSCAGAASSGNTWMRPISHSAVA
jgi:hypothetical protein